MLRLAPVLRWQCWRVIGKNTLRLLHQSPNIRNHYFDWEFKIVAAEGREVDDFSSTRPSAQSICHYIAKEAHFSGQERSRLNYICYYINTGTAESKCNYCDYTLADKSRMKLRKSKVHWITFAITSRPTSISVTSGNQPHKLSMVLQSK